MDRFRSYLNHFDILYDAQYGTKEYLKECIKNKSHVEVPNDFIVKLMLEYLDYCVKDNNYEKKLNVLQEKSFMDGFLSYLNHFDILYDAQYDTKEYLKECIKNKPHVKVPNDFMVKLMLEYLDYCVKDNN